MTGQDTFDPEDYPDDSVIAPQEVASAARSCSAILAIALVVSLILCVALSLSYIF